MSKLKSSFLTLWSVLRVVGVVALWLIAFLGAFLGYLTVVPVLVFTFGLLLYLLLSLLRHRNAVQR